MPVGTRSTFGRIGTGGLAQPAGMVADSRSRSTVTGQKENEEANEQQHDKEAAPPPKTPVARHVEEALADVEAELASAREYHGQLLSRGSRPGSLRLSQLARRIAHEQNKHSPMPSPPPRPRMEIESPASAKEIGDAVGSAIKSSLHSITKDEKGSLVSKEEAKLNKCDLSIPTREGLKNMIRTKGTLVDPRVAELFGIKYGSRAELMRIIRERDLTSVDMRVAATIYTLLVPKEMATTIALLVDATEKDAQLGVSGMLIFDWLSKQTEKMMRNSAKAIKAAFDAQGFLESGVPADLIEVQMTTLIKAIEALPAKYTDDVFDKLGLMLEKIPAHLTNDHWVQHLHHAHRRALRAGRDAPWTLEELGEEIVGGLETSDPAPAPTALAASFKNKPTGTGGDGGARAKRFAGKVLHGTIGKWLKDGKYTFIVIEGDATNVFCHSSAVVGAKPKEGDKVSFELAYEKTHANDPDPPRESAKNVQIVKAPRAAANAAIQVNTAEAGQTSDDDESDDDDGVPPTHYRAVVR